MSQFHVNAARYWLALFELARTVKPLTISRFLKADGPGYYDIWAEPSAAITLDSWKWNGRCEGCDAEYDYASNGCGRQRTVIHLGKLGLADVPELSVGVHCLKKFFAEGRAALALLAVCNRALPRELCLLVFDLIGRLAMRE